MNTENNFTKEVKNQKRRKPRQAVSKNITVKAEKKEDFKFKKENLNDLSDGLSGELYTEDGWIKNYSKERE